ncbi:carboxymuconolactone decarboxylase family protein [Pseudorhodoferax sp. Leaf265]|jgi:AhpD family alkylhydroperoxidase|uniref:carboxymuconolactone decarboxylase family protein n=1 Tax=Pseudorhodoferax sp. Leaf265 TaxID=1736315 RepID=UPI0006FA8DE6|nr:carboxymuconolactone decarboxylase family protein [Pseudorhodoferax sp. Leaf265]KQP20858.1 alkylhydroperoxidase [Pseudorhodoferax sp. Leaf265]PZP94204.1 MAG: carboxymuconolactone decarboxylase family protein [Variovorax paradoxus]PZQ04799.1 MAG: carboxymuconolactone decarboxylase family protein [Variovorax paradoxus]
MTPRLNALQQAPELYKKLSDYSIAGKKGSLDAKLLALIEIRASQMNGCAFCLDMHVKQAKQHGEGELRLHHVAIWHESPLFSARERAAFAWTEVLTQLPAHGVSDAVYEQVRAEFSEQEIVELTHNVMGINAWNRLSIAFRNVPGAADKAFGLDKVQFS